MGYLFVDRILEVSPGPDSGGWMARGLKAVARSDPYLRSGPDGRLELAPSFLGEAVGQLAAWAAMSRLGFARRPVAGLTAEVEARGTAHAGDVVSLHARIESLEDDAVHYHGEARVGGRPILLLRDCVGPLLPMEGFDDPAAVKRHFESLFSPGEPAAAEAEAPPADAAPAAGQGDGPERALRSHPAIDFILERASGRILAATCVSRASPYLEDHFPRDPVLPATLLFDAQVALALELARSDAPHAGGLEIEGGGWTLSRLRDVKMRGFVRPGSRLVSEARFREQKRDRIVVQLTGRLGERVISSAIAELGSAAAPGAVPPGVGPAAARRERS